MEVGLSARTLDYPSTIAVAVIVSVLLGSIVAAMEAALATMGEVRLKAVVDAGAAYAKQAARALRDGPKIQARFLAGRVLFMATGTSLTAYHASPKGIWAAMLACTGVGVVYSAATEIAITIARLRATRVALPLLRWLRPLECFLIPWAAPLAWISSVIVKLIPALMERDSERITELAVTHAIEQGEESGSISKIQAKLLRSALEFKNTVAHEVMVPRTQMIAIDVRMPLQEAAKLMLEEGHSRYPVYRERLDQIEGLLYAKDLFRVLCDSNHVLSNVRLEDLVRRPIFFAPQTQKIGVLLQEMQVRQVHLAVVVDEFGGTSGLVTLEDILEELVGDIQDEYDDEEEPVRQIEPGRFVADADVSVHDLEEYLGEPIQQAEGNYDSLGGMVIELAGRVPTSGESVAAGAYDLVVREADERHITKVEIIKRQPEIAAQTQ